MVGLDTEKGTIERKAVEMHAQMIGQAKDLKYTLTLWDPGHRVLMTRDARRKRILITPLPGGSVTPDMLGDVRVLLRAYSTGELIQAPAEMGSPDDWKVSALLKSFHLMREDARIYDVRGLAKGKLAEAVRNLTRGRISKTSVAGFPKARWTHLYVSGKGIMLSAPGAVLIVYNRRIRDFRRTIEGKKWSRWKDNFTNTLQKSGTPEK